MVYKAVGCAPEILNPKVIVQIPGSYGILGGIRDEEELAVLRAENAEVRQQVQDLTEDPKQVLCQ